MELNEVLNHGYGISKRAFDLAAVSGADKHPASRQRPGTDIHRALAYRQLFESRWLWKTTRYRLSDRAA